MHAFSEVCVIFFVSALCRPFIKIKTSLGEGCIGVSMTEEVVRFIHWDTHDSSSLIWYEYGGFDLSTTHEEEHEWHTTRLGYTLRKLLEHVEDVDALSRLIVESDEKIRMWQKTMVDVTTDDHEQSLLPLSVLNRRRRLQKNITWAKIVLCALEERLTRKKNHACGFCRVDGPDATGERRLDRPHDRRQSRSITSE